MEFITFLAVIIAFLCCLSGANNLGYREGKREGIVEGREQVQKEIKESGRYFDGRA